MATSTFAKQFSVPSKKADAFVNEMKKAVSPTLNSNFKSNLVHEKELRSNLEKALK